MDSRPISAPQAKKLIRQCLEQGRVAFSSHALKEMHDDELDSVDCVNVLRAGVVDPPEFVDGTWRYRVQTQRICVVVALPGAARVRIVTAWRKAR